MKRLVFVFTCSLLLVQHCVFAAGKSVLKPVVTKEQSWLYTTWFPDVPKDHWAYPATSLLAALGIMEGDEKGNFNGDAPLTRYEFSVAMARILAPSGPLYATPVSNAEQLNLEYASKLKTTSHR